MLREGTCPCAAAWTETADSSWRAEYEVVYLDCVHIQDVHPAYRWFWQHFQNLASDAAYSHNQNLGPAEDVIAPVDELVDSEAVGGRWVNLHTPNIGYNETKYYGFELHSYTIKLNLCIRTNAKKLPFQLLDMRIIVARWRENYTRVNFPQKK